jgi:DNA processing protein
LGEQEIPDLATAWSTVKDSGLRLPKAELPDLEAVSNSASKLLARCASEGIAYLNRWEDGFPERLRSIPDPPLHLFVQGNLDSLKRPGYAVVGTRTPTLFGQKAAYRIAKRVVEAGFSVISGLAEGCDTQAHLGALDSGGCTVAVLAHGFGTVYPSSNDALAKRILDEGGCLVSEYPPSKPASSNQFVARDRLQSGLAQGTIIIETGLKGGTMHTVRFTLEQGRCLAVVRNPGTKFEMPDVEGNLSLIEEKKAFPLASLKELEDFIWKTGQNGSSQTDQLPAGQQTELF